MTLGEKGAMVRSDGIVRQIPAIKIDAVDTTAAGDCFVGYLVASLMQAVPLKEAVEFACAASAICVTRMGAADSIPTRDEIVSLRSRLEA